MSDIELPSKGSSSSSTSNCGLLHGLFISVDVRNGCVVVKATVEVPTPKSVQETVFCAPVDTKKRQTMCNPYIRGAMTIDITGLVNRRLIRLVEVMIQGPHAHSISNAIIMY